MSEGLEQEVRRGALVNALGVLGKLAGPSFLVLVTRLYGPSVFGVFITATALVEMALAFLSAGFKDSALLSVARHADYASERARLYRLLANALGWSLLAALLIIAATFAAGPWLLPIVYDEYGGRLLLMLRWMVLALPMVAFDRIVVAATQGLKIMKYDAIVNGGLRPVLLLGTAVGFWFAFPTETGLAAAYVTTQAIVGIAAIFIYSRELAWTPLLKALRSFEPDRELLSFALPQNLNMTLERFMTNIDIVMLGMFGVSASTTGFYGAGAMIVRELLSIKQIFSNAYAPHIVRLHRRGTFDELSRTFSNVARWATALAIPAFLILAALRGDVLRLVHPSYAGQDALFLLILLAIPYLQCSVGLAGNIIVMTGHSRLNLLNSSVSATANTLLNVWLIPFLGLPGAALASVLAALAKAVLEMGEARYVAQARLLIRKIYPPHVAGLAAGALLAVLFTTAAFEQSLGYRIGTAIGSVGLYAALLLALQGGPKGPPLLRNPLW